MSDIKSSDLHELDQPSAMQKRLPSLSEENHSCHHKNVLISYHAKLFFFYSPIISTPLSGMLWLYSPLTSAKVSISFWNCATQIGTWTCTGGFPGGTVVKNVLAGEGDMDLTPGGKIPWRRKWKPTPVFLPGKFHGQRSLANHSPRGHNVSDITEQLSMRAHMLGLSLPAEITHLLSGLNEAQVLDVSLQKEFSETQSDR